MQRRFDGLIQLIQIFYIKYENICIETSYIWCNEYNSLKNILEDTGLSGNNMF